MFWAGNSVLYGTTGVCVVEGLIEKEIAHVKKEYHVLRPVAQPQSAVYVPVDSPALLSKVKPLLSQTELTSLVGSLPPQEPAWIEEGARRREAFAEVFSGGDRCALMQLFRTLYSQKQSLAQGGKRLSVVDERAMKEVERLLCEEFAAVFGWSPEQTLTYIVARGKID